jgi:hypothetical protein
MKNARRAGVRGLAITAAVGLGLAGVALGAIPAAAADPIVVSNSNDSGAGSLRGAIILANTTADSVIVFDPSVTAIFSSTPMDITDDVTITGNGIANTLVYSLSSSSIFTVAAGVEVLVQQLRLDGVDSGGAGISATTDASVTVNSVQITDFATGVNVVHGSLFGNGLAAISNDIGVNWVADDATDTLDIDQTTVSSNTGDGMHLEAGEGSVDITSPTIFLNGGDGIDLTTSGPASITDAAISCSALGLVGLRLGGSGDAAVHLNGVTGSACQANGLQIDLEDTARVDGAGNGGSSNGSTAISVNLSDSSVLELTDTVVKSNPRGLDAITTGSSRLSLLGTGTEFSFNGTAPGSVGAIVLHPSGSSINEIDGAWIHANGDGDTSGPGTGIAVYDVVDDAQLIIENATIEDNQTSGTGGGVYIRDVQDDAQVTVRNSVISANRADSGGAGIYVERLGDDSSFNGSMSVIDSWIDQNEGGNATGIHVDSIYQDESADQAAFLLERSTVSNGDGGEAGILLALDPESLGSALIRDSTVSGNDGAGVVLDGANEADNAIFVIENSTITGNDRGVVLDDELEVIVDHSILDGPDGLAAADPTPLVVTTFYSIINDATPALAALFDPTTRVDLDPKLGPLADNGGPTPTHFLLAGSPAIDTGDPAFTPPPSVDQRSTPRVQHLIIDIGAVEVPFVLPATGPAPAGLLALVALFALLAGVVSRRVASRRSSTSG